MTDTQTYPIIILWAIANNSIEPNRGASVVR